NQVSVANNTFARSFTNGVFVAGAGTSPTITGNTIAGNATGVSAAGVATPHINFNNITGNSSFGVLNADCPSNVACTTTPDVDATNNYWGNANGPSRDPDRPGLGDKVSFHVNFSPFFTVPITQVSSDFNTIITAIINRLGLPASFNPILHYAEP